jgi:putative DNA primase/helicase
VDGRLSWQRDGLTIPDEIRTATAQYRDGMNTFENFLVDSCVEGLSLREKKSMVYASYRAWCEQSGERAETQHEFSKRMVDRGFPEDRGAKGVRLWCGLALVTLVETHG